MLDELDKEEINLKIVSEKWNNPNLGKYLSRISNQKIKIQKEILQMFRTK